MVNGITVAYGDGIGPEIMEAVLHVLKEAEVHIKVDVIEIGEKLYKQGWSSGISKDAWDIIKKNRILLKAPITTPLGGGYKSLNVTFRKALGLFANVRPIMSYFPFVDSKFPKMDMVIVRENEEDLYAAIEYRTTQSRAVGIKLITQEGCERIIRYAFEYAKLNKRKKVTCISKDNIMKITDGLFHSTFEKISKEYPEIENNHFLIDIGAAKIATRPEIFDVVVTLNLYGDIISDIAAEVSGSIGLAGSANIGAKYAMFEAVHGSAPDIAGRGVANPSGLLNSAIMMLEHIGYGHKATLISNALLKTIEDGIHTPDVFVEGKSAKKVSTSDFGKAVADNLGQNPSILPITQTKSKGKIVIPEIKINDDTKVLTGVDVFMADMEGKTIDEIASQVKNLSDKMTLRLMSQRGQIVWPFTEVENVTPRMLRLRYVVKEDIKHIEQSDIVDLLAALVKEKLDFAMIHTLHHYEGKEGYTKAQGE